MTYARIVTAKFKPGKREEGMRIIDEFKGYAEDPKGFQGILALLSTDDPDVATLVTMWDSEETLDTSREGIFNKVMVELEELLEGPVDVHNQKLREMRWPEIIHTDIYST
jgi:quinol monooxygenase YgiN